MKAPVHSAQPAAVVDVVDQVALPAPAGRVAPRAPHAHLAVQVAWVDLVAVPVVPVPAAAPAPLVVLQAVAEKAGLRW